MVTNSLQGAEQPHCSQTQRQTSVSMGRHRGMSDVCIYSYVFFVFILVPELGCASFTLLHFVTSKQVQNASLAGHNENVSASTPFRRRAVRATKRGRAFGSLEFHSFIHSYTYTYMYRYVHILMHVLHVYIHIYRYIYTYMYRYVYI